jgi:hypothetical protein
MSNAAHKKLTGSRVSEPEVVDNTGPAVEIQSIEGDGDITLMTPARVKGEKVTLKIAAFDKFSVVTGLHYTIDSNDDFKAAVPDDLVYDTMREEFTIVLDELKPGEHVIALKVEDAVGNTTYKTFEIIATTK